MNKYRLALFLSLMILSATHLNNCTLSVNKGGPGAVEQGSPPVVTFAWAQDRIRQGDEWRIYLSATDPDGEMERIYCRIHQVGGDNYGIEIIPVKKGMGHKLTGYIILRTNSTQDLFGLSLTLTLVIADRAGNESQPFGFPLTINGEPMKPLPADQVPADLSKELNKKIGLIGTRLVRPRDRRFDSDSLFFR